MKARSKGNPLRKKAERVLARKAGVPQKISGDIERLVHELQVHQIELEMQNDELRKAQEEIEESRRKYVDLYDFAPVGYFTLDKNAGIIEANLTGANLLGFERTRLFKSLFIHFIMPEERDLFMKFWRKFDENPGRQSCELRLKTEASGPLWVGLEGTVVYAPDGKFTGVRLALIDITERREAERALRESEERFRNAEKVGKMGHFSLNVVKGSITGSPYLESIHGFEPGAFKGGFENWLEMVHPDDKAKIMKFTQEAFHKKLREGAFDIRILRPNGEVRWVSAGVTVTYDPSGRPLRALGTMTDITERKRIEERLRQSEKRSKLLIKYAPSMICEVDFNGPAFRSVNDVMCDYLGYPRKELLAMNPFDLRDEEGKTVFRDRLNRILNGEKIKGPVECKTKSKDGRELYALLNMALTYKDGKPEGAVIMAHDVTERKRAEQALADRTFQLERANRKLAVINADIDEFTNVASHDLQEPLRTLISFSDLLRKDLGDALPEEAAKDLAFITNAAKRMQTLIRDLLALSRAERVAKKREWVSLDECADLALEALATLVKERRAQIMRDNLPEVWGDSTLLTELYQNLISNALKFSGDQRPIIQLTFEEKDGNQIFGVKDNGIGIDPKYAQQIFQPFRRLHGRAKYEGSGIGLAICHRLVERHRGKIWVDSEPGKGAHFRFMIPYRKREG